MNNKGFDDFDGNDKNNIGMKYKNNNGGETSTGGGYAETNLDGEETSFLIPGNQKSKVTRVENLDGAPTKKFIGGTKISMSYDKKKLLSKKYSILTLKRKMEKIQLHW